MGIRAYAGVSNDYCRDTLPLMLELGFEPVALLTWWSISFEQRMALRQPELAPGRKSKEFPYLFHEGPRHAGSTHERTSDGQQRGVREARAYCRREAAYLTNHNVTGAIKEGNAYFRRAGTSLPLPPVERNSEDWVLEHAHFHSDGKLRFGRLGH